MFENWENIWTENKLQNKSQIKLVLLNSSTIIWTAFYFNIHIELEQTKAQSPDIGYRWPLVDPEEHTLKLFLIILSMKPKPSLKAISYLEMTKFSTSFNLYLTQTNKAPLRLPHLFISLPPKAQSSMTSRFIICHIYLPSI